MYKRILSVIVSLAVLLGIVSPMGEISKAYAASEKLERALQWAIAIANDNSHGYYHCHYYYHCHCCCHCHGCCHKQRAAPLRGRPVLPASLY